MDASATISISLIIALVGAFSAAYNVIGQRKRETAEAAARLEDIRTGLIKVNLKLDQVCNVTTETRSDIKAMDSRIQDLERELGLVKRDLKTAFVRIDELKEAHHE